jgi:hypothetical protein
MFLKMFRIAVLPRQHDLWKLGTAVAVPREESSWRSGVYVETWHWVGVVDFKMAEELKQFGIIFERYKYLTMCIYFKIILYLPFQKHL